MTFASEARLAAVPWRALAGLAPALDAPLAEALGGAAAERVVDRFLRAHRGLSAEARRAAKEAIYGVALWRRRLTWHAGDARGDAAPRLLLAALLRDLGGAADAEALLGLPPGALPPPRPPPDDLAARLSFPGWLWASLVEEAGLEAPALADALNLPGPVALRPNLLRTTRDALAALLAAEGVATAPGRLAPGALRVTSPRLNVYGLAAWREGLFEVQDEASQLAAALVEARPGEAVLDLCAGAGGKSLALAAAVGPGGAVTACDVDAGRLARLGARARRAGAAAIVRAAGAEPPPGAAFDAALVDAPCSELGALRRGPDQRFRLDPAAFAPLPALQGALLARAAARLRPGGRLVYATCTFRRAEDEEVAAAFERAHPGFAREAAVRTWPHRDGADAFFAARWRKAGGRGDVSAEA